MKSKVSLYILLPLVIAIWGLIAWKIFGNRSEQTSMTITMDQKTSEKENEIFDQKLALDYEDPFLRKSGTKAGSNEEIKSPLFSYIPEKISNLNIDIKYFGYVESKGRRTGLIKLNGKYELVNKDSPLDSFEVGNLYSDSIIIYHNGKKLSFSK